MSKYLSLVVLFSVLALANVARAATITVCPSGCDHTSIIAAIGAATGGDVIDIAAGVYTEANITVNKALTIQGAGAESTIVQAHEDYVHNQGPTYRVFLIQAGNTVTLADMTIRHGNVRESGSWSQGGGINNAGTLTVLRCIVAKNRVSNATNIQGGGIYSSGTLTVEDSVIEDNFSDFGNGGGLYIIGGGVTISRSIIRANVSASYGGGMYINTGAGVSNFLTDTVISGNYTSQGAGILNDSVLVIYSTTISGNFAGGNGGAICNEPHGTNDPSEIYMTNSTVSGNYCASTSSNLRAGGLLNEGTMRLDNVTVYGNGFTMTRIPTIHRAFISETPSSRAIRGRERRATAAGSYSRRGSTSSRRWIVAR
jgi:hypothetical protein